MKSTSAQHLPSPPRSLLPLPDLDMRVYARFRPTKANGPCWELFRDVWETLRQHHIFTVGELIDAMAQETSFQFAYMMVHEALRLPRCFRLEHP